MFFQLLDAAERGEEVILDRRGKRFRLIADASALSAPPPSPLVVRDADVLSGQWHWSADANGQLEFEAERTQPTQK